MSEGLSRPDRLQIMLSAEEIKAVDDWRFARRMPSRAAAVRELLRVGLSIRSGETAAAGRHSTSFGVLSEPAAAASGDGSEPG